VVLPRLIQLGADLNRIFIAPAYRDPHAYRWPKQRRKWRQHLRDHRPALTIIDPLFAFLASSTVDVEERLRDALSDLRELAEEFASVMLMSRHLTKTASGPAVTLGQGRVALSASCPTVWLAARDPAEPGRCVLAESKNNYGPGLQPSLGYSLAAEDGDAPTGELQIADCGLQIGGGSEKSADQPGAGDARTSSGKLQIEDCRLQIDGGGENSQPAGRDVPPHVEICNLQSEICNLQSAICNVPLTWHGPCDWTADQLSSRAAAADVTAVQEAKSFLNGFLASGPRTARALWRAAKQLGLSRRTVQRAKKALRILHRPARTPSGRTATYWHFAHQKVPDPRLPSPPNLEPWLKPLREKYSKRAVDE